MLLTGDAPCVWLIVRSTPDMSRSALLSRWPHHFILCGDEWFDQPLRITCSLEEHVMRSTRSCEILMRRQLCR